MEQSDKEKVDAHKTQVQEAEYANQEAPEQYQTIYIPDKLSKVRAQLVKKKEFLRTLFSVNSMQAKTLINAASIFQVNLVLKVAHYICSSPMKKSISLEIKKKRKMKVLRSAVQKQSCLKTLLAANRAQKLKFLYKITNIFQLILHPIFVKEEDANQEAVTMILNADLENKVDKPRAQLEKSHKRKREKEKKADLEKKVDQLEKAITDHEEKMTEGEALQNELQKEKIFNADLKNKVDKMRAQLEKANTDHEEKKANIADLGKIILKMILDQIKIIFSKTILDQIKIIFFQRNDLDLRSIS
jgi:hypothetical protein